MCCGQKLKMGKKKAEKLPIQFGSLSYVNQ